MVTKTEKEKDETAKARKARKAETAKVRYAKAKAAKAEAAVTGVPVQSLEIGQRFNHDGDLFQVDSIQDDLVLASKLEFAQNGEGMRPAWQRNVLVGTLVEPAK